MSARRIRCAIYTRKSTEEGLDQAFNSLDAQREACAAYVLSQAGEGWVGLPQLYDDGGYSGGSMERPALQRLLEDIGNGHVDVVVVYKIDRLTRSLADFARIVERFEARGTSFVSVTQAFNTTTSMGRLTLNVLLSFAQFEREVGAERVRDKIAASRKKGIYMGGTPPLGYDPRDGKLVINEAEAETVRFMFRRYLELKSVGQLRQELEDRGSTTKDRITGSGRRVGGNRWHVGPVRFTLRNPVYVGEARHKENLYPGEHEAIIDRETFDAVQALLKANAVEVNRIHRTENRSLLAGLIHDDRGNIMTPQRTSAGMKDRRYCHYVSQAILQHRKREAGSLARVSAPPAEGLVTDIIGQIAEVTNNTTRWNGATEYLRRRALLRRWLKRFIVSKDTATLTLDASTLAPDGGITEQGLANYVGTKFDTKLEVTDGEITLTLPAQLKISSGAWRRELWDNGGWRNAKTQVDRSLITALARAHRWRRLLESGEAVTIDELAKRDGMERRHAQRTLRLAFLAPDLQQLIVTGRQPPTLQLSTLLETDLPVLWAEQRSALGI